MVFDGRPTSGTSGVQMVPVRTRASSTTNVWITGCSGIVWLVGRLVLRAEVLLAPVPLEGASALIPNLLVHRVLLDLWSVGVIRSGVELALTNHLRYLMSHRQWIFR
jgi:hypothetical protein